MDANGNQRKRAGRATKSANNNESISPAQNTDSNEVLEVSAVAISPTLEEAETSTSNAPVAECRRSSRKKIIKFDVRDLLNKNRKTHKIQIEARIDSNAPTTSKASTAGGTEQANSKTSTNVREDLLSKQKTFLEKSAIFRRYSISQEHKPPPPPLPIPPLLGKPSDSDEANLAGTSTNRRLSRTQEFFSNAMIKPKQTTSLIVAQIESNTPSSTSTTTTTKQRKALNKSIEIDSKTDTDSSPVVQQKRRGRPAKFKTPTSVETTSTTCVQDATIEKKQITPEKAKNWKEYKACLAQSEKDKNEKNSEEKIATSEILVNLEEISQSDLSKSDDDGNFSGFQTSKDDINRDTPIIAEISTGQNVESEKKDDSQENKDDAKISIVSEMKETEVTKVDVEILDSKLDILHESDTTQKEQIKTAEEPTESKEIVSFTDSDEDNKIGEEKSLFKETAGISKEQEIENQTKITKEQNLLPKNLEEQDIKLPEETEDKVENTSQDVYHSGVKLLESSEALQQPKRSKRRQLKNEKNQRKSPSPQNDHETEKTLVDSSELTEEPTQPSTSTETEAKTTAQSPTIEEQTEFARKLNTPDLIKATKIIDECTPETKLTPSDILLITSQLPQSQPTTPSEETMKSFSRTSSSSESENASYSSDPASSTSSSSSSSSRSYKSGDKLRISLKRISLPKSPSTSSQTSTSEELNASLNQTEVLKKKPPIAKRSKRLQKKFVEMLENKNDTENTDDDCCKRTTNEEEIKQEEQISKEMDNTMVKDDEGDNKVEQDKADTLESSDVGMETKESSEKTKIVVDKPLEIVEPAGINITEEENDPRTDNLESLSTEIQEQSNQEQIIKDSSSVNKRKSLRNRKDNKDQNVEEDGTSLNINSEKKDMSSTDIMEKSKEKLEESSSDFEIASTLESDKNDDTENKPKRKTRNSQPSKQLQRKLKKQTSLNDDKAETTNKIEQEIKSEDQMKDIEKCSSTDKVISENDNKDQEIQSKTTLTGSKNIEERTVNLGPIAVETNQSLTLKDTTQHENESRTEKLDKPTKVIKTRSKNKDEATAIKSIIKEENLPSSDLKDETNSELVKEDSSETLSDSQSNKTISPDLKDETISEMAKEESSETLTDSQSNKAISPKATQDVEMENLDNKPTEISTSDKIITQDEMKCETSQITESEEVDTTKETKIIEEQTNKPSESSTKEKSTKAIRVETDNKTPARNKSKKANETPEIVKSKAASSQKSTKTVTGKTSPEPPLKPDREAESDQKTADEEIINTKTMEEERPSTPKRSSRQVSSNKSNKTVESIATDETKDSLTTQRSVTSSPKSVISETVSERSETTETLQQSTKRKSLRKQKDKNDKEESLISAEMPKSSEEVSVAISQIEDSQEKEETKTKSEETVKVLKRKGRKSRFKNLHTPDIESETDSSNGKNTPLDEIMQQKTKEESTLEGKDTLTDAEQSKSTESTKESLQITENIAETNPITESPEVSKEIESLKETSKSNLSSSQIQNVSIETNTLLDILRTVQSNTEAALKTNKPSAEDVQNTEQEINSESFAKMEVEDSTKKSSQELLSASQELKPTSPTRSNTNSPAILKRMPISPTRSESASPLKKVVHSPTRSDSSSPLTLKKVTRRYERRSRRGEDVAHKTLEETFAEIAAESSKAVLAAKEFDINVEEPTNEENPAAEINVINTEISKEKAEVIGSVSEVENPSQLSEEINSKPDEKTEDTDLKVEQNLDDIDKPEEQELKQIETEEKSSENILDFTKCTKITPARKGRKPKNTPTDAAENKEELEEKLSSSKIDAGTSIPKEVIEEKPSLETQEETKVENKKPKTKKAKEATQTEKLTEDEINNIKTPATTSEIVTGDNSAEPAIEITKSLDDKNDNKSNKKPFKKRDSFKAETQPVDSTNLEHEPTNEKEDEVHTPKQPPKKRDTSQTKSETKSTGKKSTKKTKNDEEDSSSLQKDDTSTKSITPPPTKRGRKPKNQQDTPQSSSNSKKKNKKELTSDNKEGDNGQENINPPESEAEGSTLDKSLDEKLAKKKRQKKLKEAFEAALTDDANKSKEQTKTESSVNFGLTELKKSPTPPNSSTDPSNDSKKITCVTPAPETEEEPDPLKDIEKFIADGVNLLKKDYKLDEDSVDDVMAPTPANVTTEVAPDPVKSNTEETENQVVNTFETPADTPINTPSATPPPKSPTSLETSTADENSGVRRSHRIKLITKTPKALVGRGLVRDKERFSIKDDVETKSHYTLDDHLTDLAEVEAKNAKFLKEMEERLSNFQVIKENEYLCERVISREAKKMICDCFLTQEEEERGELGCGEDCLNRLLMIECGPDCNVKERCTNKRFQKLLCSPCRVFRTEKKGFGIMADIEILPGEFIMEYVGEVIDTDEFEKRRITYSQDKNRHYYFMALRSDAIIDATIKGNISRFINHSCDPNAETQKWTVNGELRIGFFSRKSIMPGEEITFNYQYQRYGREAQRCYCESANCRGWIGQEPTSDEGEQIDDDEEDESDDEEEEADTSNLLVQDDDEDSDASVADPEEVQKQLEMAAAQAEAELAPLQLLEEKNKQQKSVPEEGKSPLDITKSESDEDSKSKFKKLLSKMAEKVAAKQKQTKREQKLQRKKKSKESSTDLSNKLKFLEDPDIEDEVEFLKECGLKNQSDTLRLSRLMVRAKLVQTRLNLLEILRKGDLPCRRLFLDYHGLRLLHGWMSEDAGNMQIRLALLQTLETLPIANKTVLTDSKVMQVARNWCGNTTNLSPNEDSSSSNSNSQDVPVSNAPNFEEGSEMAELQKLAQKLISTWEGLPEIFRIPKKERIEQMKEHEREADRQYAANAETQENNLTTDRYRRDRFGRGLNTSSTNNSNRFLKPNNGNPHRPTNSTPENNKNLSKAQRREMFAAKVARDEAEKRLAEERREFETKCRFFGLDPKKTRPQDIPFCVNPATGQWFSIERKPITTPPSYAHVQVPVKPKSTDPNDYQLPAVCSTLPPQWKYAITPQGKIYYYHIKHRIPQWEPPSPAQLQECEMEGREEDSESELTTTAGEDSSDDDDDVLIGMDAAQLKAYIDRKVEMRRQKRYQRLVDERSISPRREEDRIYNQIEVRKYKENKEKIRKRKEEIRRRRAEALRQTSLNMCTLGSISETNPSSTNKTTTESDDELGALPIQDYLLSSDEEVDLKAEVNSPLMDKIVEGDKIVDELDALTTKRQLKRPLPPHRDLSEASTSSAATSGLSTALARQEYKKRKLDKKEKRKPKEQQDAKYRKTKEKFRCEIAGIIVHHLKPYRKDNCTVGRIQSDEDFNHLARKLTHFVMIKELKYCESVGQTLVVTESVKSKSREFIKKYMAKYGEVYVKPINDPNFKDIPFTL